MIGDLELFPLQGTTYKYIPRKKSRLRVLESSKTTTRLLGRYIHIMPSYVQNIHFTGDVDMSSQRATLRSSPHEASAVGFSSIFLWRHVPPHRIARASSKCRMNHISKRTLVSRSGLKAHVYHSLHYFSGR